ncbi:hypothetical protein ACIQBJ_13795 [Kitasatospora sp. NPDC088391]|uniref:hypothetical protein n=1 Tax=Kitasatospora sp. NPDC088391 TaxID=3364074 RepID=UPI00381904C6
MNDRLVETIAVSPLRSLFQARFGSRIDRALVFLSREGDHRMVHPLGPKAAARPPSFAMVHRRAFGRVCWVSLADREAQVEVATRTTGGRRLSTLRRTVTWRASDPVEVARRWLSAEEALRWIARDAEHAYPEPYTQDGQPVSERQVAEIGIAYRLRSFLPEPAEVPSHSPDTPAGWGQEQRDTYRFYQEAFAQGPRSLAALWLLHHPDQARDVLEWSVQHKALLTERAEWESALVGLLQGLGAEHRAFLGVKLAEVLGEFGVAGAGPVLDRIRGEQPPHPPLAPGVAP